MSFKLINQSAWHRKQYFTHYTETVPCTYSMTIDLDITGFLQTLKRRNFKFYPAIIHAIARTVNQYEEFRMAFDPEDNLGVFELMHPAYTIFHQDDETFSSIWTEYHESLVVFYQSYLKDIAQFSTNKDLFAKPHLPENAFHISSIPWLSFLGFNLNLPQSGDYLLPIFTLGKYHEQNAKTLLPISIQVHHAVCDGFHLSRFVQSLQTFINDPLP